MCSRFLTNARPPRTRPRAGARAIGVRAIAALIGVAATAAAQPARPAFRICAEPDAWPMSRQNSAPGYEIEIASVIAKDLSRQLEVKWIPQRDHSYFAQTLGRGTCDAIMGVPTDFTKVTTTEPYFKGSFVFVSRKPITSFDDPSLRKMRIAVPSTGLGETPPALALTKRSLAQNLREYSIYTPSKMIDAINSGDVDAAILWGPFGGYFSRNSSLIVSPGPDKDGEIPLAFDISVAVRKGNTRLRDQINGVLAREHAKITDILKKWHVPLKES